jgi:hypothetical protein
MLLDYCKDELIPESVFEILILPQVACVCTAALIYVTLISSKWGVRQTQAIRTTEWIEVN